VRPAWLRLQLEAVDLFRAAQKEHGAAYNLFLLECQPTALRKLRRAAWLCKLGHQTMRRAARERMTVERRLPARAA
jgi:hypothetical protein